MSTVFVDVLVNTKHALFGVDFFVMVALPGPPSPLYMSQSAPVNTPYGTPY
jgi:hypothetical protein